jgi:hypothetical protein
MRMYLFHGANYNVELTLIELERREKEKKERAATIPMKTKRK